MNTFREYLNKAIGVPSIKPPETMRPVKPVHMQPHVQMGPRSPVQNPGKHGSTKWYRDDQNKVVYGTRPTPRAHGFQGPEPSMEESNSYEPIQHHIPHVQTKTSHGWESDPTEANSYEPIQTNPRPIKEFPKQHGIKPHHMGTPKPSSYHMPWTGHPVDSAVREWLHTNMPGQDEAEALTNLPIGYGKMFQQHFASKGLPVRSARPTPLSTKEKIQFTARQAGTLNDTNQLVSKYPKLVERTRLRQPIAEPDSIDKLREHIAAAQDIMHERKAHLPHDFPPYPKQEGVGYALNQWKNQHPRNTTQNAVDFWSGLNAQEKEQVTQHVINSVQSAQTPQQIHNIWGHPDAEAAIEDTKKKIVANKDDPIKVGMLKEQLDKQEKYLASKLPDVDKLHEDLRESVRGFLANTSSQRATREAHHAWVNQTTNAKKLIGSVGPDGKWTHTAPEEPAHLDRHSETSIRQAWTAAILKNDLWIAKQEGDSTRLQDLKDNSTPEEFVKHMLPYFTRAIATQGQGEVTRFINSTADDARDVADDIYFALYEDGSRVDQYGKALKAPAKGKPLDADAPSPERVKEFRSQMDTTFHRPTLKSMMAYGVEPLWVERLFK